MQCKLLQALGLMLVAMSCFGDVPGYGQTAEPEKITFESIQDVWRQRQKKFSSAKFTLTIDKRESQYSIFLVGSSAHMEVLRDPAAVAKLQSEYHDTRLDVQISIRGDCMAYHERPLALDGKPLFDSFVLHCAYDGTVSAFLNEQGPYPGGEIFKLPQCSFEDSMDHVPIVWVFGNWDRAMQLAAMGRVHVTEASAATVIDSHPCVVLEFPDDGGVGCKKYWLAQDAEYSILRYAATVYESVVAQFDCHYVQSKEGCWTPTKWTSTLFHDDGSPRIACRVVATNYEINPAFPEGEFQITFPPGTWVTDARLDGDDKRDGQFDGFLVKPDGSKRMITRDEVFASYEELMNTETGKAVTKFKRATRGGVFSEKSRWCRLAANVSLLIVFCGLFYVRQRRKRCSP
jgi:hypothetical protein